MAHLNLRNRARISYYEPVEPDTDEYIFCTECKDFVYEYCSVHGALLVVPDDKVTSLTDYPSFVPRAALTVPQVFLHITHSLIPGAGLGVFSSLTLPADVRFGPYRGTRASTALSMYCWQLHRNGRPLQLVDASDPNTNSNWLRYVNCARHVSEQNLVAYQYRGEIYYRTMRIIPRHTELLVYYGSEFAHRLGIDIRNYNKPNCVLPYYTGIPRLPDQDSAKSIEVSETIVTSNYNNKSDKLPTDINTELILICDHCKAKFDTKDNLRQHIVAGNVFPHNENTEKSKILLKELSEDKRDKYFNSELRICDVCDYKSKSTKKNNRHLRNHTSEKPHKCNVCDYRTNQNSHLKRHIMTHTGEKPYKCNMCEYKTASNTLLNVHIRTHTGEKPFECNMCNFRTTSNSSLNQHIRTHTGEKPHKCNICEYKTASNTLLKIHIRTHTGEKPYKCNICDYRAVRSTRLKIHIRTHTGEKPHKCNICEYKTASSTRLKIHIRTHTGEKLYKCNICDYRAVRSTCLKTHIMIHTGEKPYKCNICDYRTTSKSSLNRHIRTHTGEKPYKCNICDYRAVRSTCLKTHIMIHTGEKPYKCNICDYRTTSKSSLNRHIRTHTGEKPHNF